MVLGNETLTEELAARSLALINLLTPVIPPALKVVCGLLGLSNLALDSAAEPSELIA